MENTYVIDQTGKLESYTDVLRSQRPLPPPLNPADQGIAPDENDDTSPPNSCPRDRFNCFAAVIPPTTAGFSAFPERKYFKPDEISVSVNVRDSENMSLEYVVSYTNPHYEKHQESMMLWIKNVQTCVQFGTPFELVETKYQDYDSHTKNWVTLNSDIRYSDMADAVVTAVAEADDGTTAGRTKLDAFCIDTKVGPVGSQARLILLFQCNIKSYEYMGVQPDGSDIGCAKVCPLLVQLPWDDLLSTGGLIRTNVSITAQTGSWILDISENRGAYETFVEEHSQKVTNVATMIAPQLDQNWNFQTSFACLPAQPWCIVCWLCIPPADEVLLDGFVDLALSPSIGQTTNTTTKQPDIDLKFLLPPESDAEFLKANLPGNDHPGRLVRAELKVNALPQEETRMPRVFIDLTVSDSSGSTGASAGNQNVRSRFNAMAIRRLVLRLRVVPSLVQSGILRTSDVIVPAFYAFHNTVYCKKLALVKVQDILSIPLSEMDNFLQQLINPDMQVVANGTPALNALITSLKDFTKAIGNIRPCGGTDFASTASYIVNDFEELKSSVCNDLNTNKANLEFRTFVNWDTDGGDHSGRASSAVSSLIDTCSVLGGCVVGYGAWVNQRIASTIGNLLGGKAFLGAHVPTMSLQDAATDVTFRGEFDLWIKTLKLEIVKSISISCGFQSWNAFHGLRHEAGLELLGGHVVDKEGAMATSKSLFHGEVDISEMEYTTSEISDVRVGEKIVLYFISRLDRSNLRSLQQRFGSTAPNTLKVKLNDRLCDQTQIGLVVAEDKLQHQLLAYDWVRKLSNPMVLNSLVACSRLVHRILDDLSFNYNIVLPDGSTSFLGRAKTNPDYKPIPRHQQPSEPDEPLKAPPPMMFGGGMFGGARGRGRGRGLSLLGVKGAKSKSAFSAPSSMFGAGAPPTPPGGGMFGAQLSMANFSNSNQAESRKWASRKSAKTSEKKDKKKKKMSKILAPKYEAETITGPPNWTTVLERSDHLRVSFLERDNGATGPWDNQKNSSFARILKTAIGFITLQQNRYPGDATSFQCDICSTTLNGSQGWHCADCNDFDLCIRCYNNKILQKSGSIQHPTGHRFYIYKYQSSETFHPLIGEIKKFGDLSTTPRLTSSSVTTTSEEDPFTTQLLGPVPKQSETTLQQSDMEAFNYSHMRKVDAIVRCLSYIGTWWVLASKVEGLMHGVVGPNYNSISKQLDSLRPIKSMESLWEFAKVAQAFLDQMP